jgi:uncharacterized protein YdbL (DUF1318 family)
MNIKALFIAAALAFTSMAQALTLDEAQAQGLLGENASGYLEMTPRGNADAKALMDDINAKRKAKYQGIANKQNTALENIEKIAGEKIQSKLSAGEFYKDASGKWNKK